MNNHDLLVDLNSLTFQKKPIPYKIKRVLSPDSDKVISFIKEHFTEGWASEAKAALYKTNPTCFIAVDNQQVIGFACYDATAKGFFGPLGVDQNYRKQGIGEALLMYCLEALYFDGYAYAFIGGVSEQTEPFYRNACGCVPIENSLRVYNRMIK